MRSFLLVIALSVFLAAPSSSEVFESWESWYGPLDVVGTGDPPIIAELRLGWPIDPIHGTQYLELINNSPTGEPRALVAWVKNLGPNDVVEVSLYWHDAVPDTFLLSVL